MLFSDQIVLQDQVIAHISEGLGPAEAVHWTNKQSYIAMGQMLFAAALLKIDACPMEGLDPAKYDQILGLEETDYHAVAVVALGYRDPNDKYQNAKKVRFGRDAIFETV